MNLLYIGHILALGVTYYNFKVIKFGFAEIDITEDEILMKKIGVPASLFEIAFIIWALSFLEKKIVFMFISVSLIAFIFKIMKLNGYKFVMFVLTPLLETIIMFYGLYLLQP